MGERTAASFVTTHPEFVYTEDIDFPTVGWREFYKYSRECRRILHASAPMRLSYHAFRGAFASMVHTTAPILPGDLVRGQFEKRHRVLDLVTCALIALSPFALGGTHPVAAAVLCTAILFSCCLSLLFHRHAGLSPRHYWPVYVIAGFSAWVLLRSTALGAFSNPPLADDAWHLWPELTTRGGIAPGRAALWALRTLTFTLSAWYAAQRFSRSDRVAWPILSVMIGAVSMALVGVAQVLTRSSEILWLYTPIDWSRVTPLAGPFVNPNQAGAFAGLAAVLAFTVARSSPVTKIRAIFIVMGIPLVAYVALLDARGALVATIAALGVLLLSSLVEHRPKPTRSLVTIAAPLGVVATITVLLYSVAPMRGIFEDGTLQNKVMIWRRALEVPFHAPLFGFGPRGFQDAFAALGLNLDHVWIEDPESGIIQLFSEHGFPIALLLCGIVVWIYIRVQQQARGNGLAIATGMAAIWSYILVETATGMALHASSYLLASGALFGIMLGRGIREKRPTNEPKHFVGPALVLGLSLLTLLVSPASIRVSLEDSRVPLFEELHAVPVTDPRLVERGLAMAQQTPGRVALIQQLALVYSAQNQAERALQLAIGLREAAPNYPSAQRAAIRIALDAGDTETACTWLRAYADDFRTLPASEVTRWVEQASPEQRCFDNPELQLRAAQAFVEAGKSELAYSQIFQLAAAPSPSSPVLVEAVRASTSLKIPELADLWVEQLLVRDDLSEQDFHTLLRWARTTTSAATTTQKITEEATAHFPKNAEFRVIYAESFLETLPENGDASWYQDLKPVIDASRTLARGDRAMGQRVTLLSANAAWLAQRWEDAEKQYRRLNVDNLSRDQAVLTLFRLGEIARQREDLYQAQRYYRAALEKNGRYLPAIQALQNIGG